MDSIDARYVKISQTNIRTCYISKSVAYADCW